MKTIYEIYYIKPSSNIDYFLKIGKFLRELKEKKTNHFLLSFDTHKIEKLIDFSPSLQMEFSVWNRLKKISFPVIYKVLPFSELNVPVILRCYERGKDICARIGDGIDILFVDKLFDIDEVKEELLKLGFKKVVIFEKNYPRFLKIKMHEDIIMVYNPSGKENVSCPYSMVFKDSITERKEENKEVIYMNTSPEEFFYLTERYFEKAENFTFKDSFKNKDFVSLKKIENLLFKIEYLISYKAFCNSLDYSYLQNYLFEEFVEFIDGKISLNKLKNILSNVQNKIGFSPRKTGSLFNPFPFSFQYADKRDYIIKEIQPYDFVYKKEVPRVPKTFKFRRSRKNEYLFLHKEEDKEPLSLKLEIKKGDRIIRGLTRETSFEKGRYYRVDFEYLKFSDGEIKVKTIYSHFYPYVIFEGTIKGEETELWFYLNSENRSLKSLSHRLKTHVDRGHDYAYLLYPLKDIDFAVFSPFPFFFESVKNHTGIKLSKGPFMLVFYPYPQNEKDVYDKFLPYIYSPITVSEKNADNRIFFTVKDGIFILYSLKQIDLTKFLLRGLCVSRSLKIHFPTSPGEVKLMDLKLEKELEILPIKNNEIKIENKPGETISLLIDFKTSAREIF
jgi:hypothetical protein